MQKGEIKCRGYSHNLKPERNERNLTKLSLFTKMEYDESWKVSPKPAPILDRGLNICSCKQRWGDYCARELLPIVQGSSYQVLLCKAAHTPSQVSPPAASQLLHHPPSSHHPYSPSAMYTSQLHQSQLLPLLKLHTRPLSSYSTSQPRTFNNIP